MLYFLCSVSHLVVWRASHRVLERSYRAIWFHGCDSSAALAMHPLADDCCCPIAFATLAIFAAMTTTVDCAEYRLFHCTSCYLQ